MKVTLKDLETAYQAVISNENEITQIIAPVIKREITRRKNAGAKPTSNLSRREQNRINQQKYRERQKDLHNKQN